MEIKFTYTAEIDVPIEAITDDVDMYLDNAIRDYISDYNDVVGTMSSNDFESLILENKTKIRKKVIDKLLEMCYN